MKLKENKQLSYVLNVPIRHGELTVMAAESAEDSMIHSMRLASAIQKSGIGVLIINCGMSGRRFHEHFCEHYEDMSNGTKVVIFTSVLGNLAGERDTIESLILEGGIGVVILVGWEWASDTRNRKARLLTFLRELMEVHNVAMITYANTAHELKAGRSDRGGLGKLTLLAYAVGRVESTEVLEVVAPRRAPIVFSEVEHREAMLGVHKLMKKFNELPRQNPDDGGEYAVAA